MLQVLRARLHRDDEDGFTLIELMVVVLIIAILLAIAIPTFLGARTKAQDRASQSNLRNALTAEKTYYVDNQQYTATLASLTAIEPSLTYAASAAPAVVNSVYVTVSTVTNTNDTIVLASKSASGKCFYLQDTTGTGTTYESDTACGAAAAAAYGPKW
jgi:type IV pilus assembly protein PilA